MDDSRFAQAIREHLALKRRNGWLEGTMPLDGYIGDEISNHALFRSEADALSKEAPPAVEPKEVDIWSTPPIFDWGS
jgi:hypothetical protein